MYGLKHKSAQKSGVVSKANSIARQLAADELWEGEWEECSDYATVSSLVRTDTEPAGLNFDIQFSIDGIAVDYSSPIHIQSGGEGTAHPHLHTVLAKYCRAAYTNGPDVANVRIQTLLHRTRDRERTITANEPLTESEDATAIRAMTDFNMDISREAFSYAKVIHKFGHNEDLGTVIEHVWSVGGIYVWLTAGATLEAISNHVNDTAAGSGARSIVVEGLDDSFNEITEVIVMNGTSASAATTQLFRRVNRAYILTSGTYHFGSDGDITVRLSGAGAIQCEIQHTTADLTPWKFGQTQLARYSVPAGKTCLIRRITAENDSDKLADMIVCTMESADVIAAPFTAPRLLKEFSGISGARLIEFESPHKVAEKSDIWANARLRSGSTTKVTVDFEIIIHDGVL